MFGKSEGPGETACVKPPDKIVTHFFFLISQQKHVVGTQKNRIGQHAKHMFKLMGKKINAILG